MGQIILLHNILAFTYQYHARFWVISWNSHGKVWALILGVIIKLILLLLLVTNLIMLTWMMDFRNMPCPCLAHMALPIYISLSIIYRTIDCNLIWWSHDSKHILTNYCCCIFIYIVFLCPKRFEYIYLYIIHVLYSVFFFLAINRTTLIYA